MGRSIPTLGESGVNPRALIITKMKNIADTLARNQKKNRDRPSISLRLKGEFCVFIVLLVKVLYCKCNTIVFINNKNISKNNKKVK
jgi:hypothetical protein